MVMAVVMGGAIAVVAVIITDGVEVEAITMVGGIIVIGNNFSSRGRLSWRPLSLQTLALTPMAALPGSGGCSTPSTRRQSSPAPGSLGSAMAAQFGPLGRS
jgi:hypothetical protein